MLGHKLCQTASERYDVFATFRRSPADVFGTLLDPEKWRCGTDAGNIDSIRAVLNELQPDVVVNCVGIVKQLAKGKDPVTCISINSLFPHLVARECRELGIRLIHISTDCVFKGSRGMYCEDDFADADDLYGRSKFLGEVAAEGCLTLRTSIIGRELSGAHGLVEWFLSQQGESVRGFQKAVFSGMTTYALSELIGQVIYECPTLSGVYQVAAEPIAKYDLLHLIRHVYGVKIQIEPDAELTCDRSLDGRRFRDETGIAPPSWQAMIEQMHSDPTPYEDIRTRVERRY